MLEIVAQGFKAAKAALTGRTTLTAENIDGAMRAIRTALLEADVELGVVRNFLARVKERAIGEVVALTVQDGGGRTQRRSPGEHFVKICQDELTALMGPVEAAPLTFRRPLTTIMLVGLQGTGKTTTCGKLAHYLLANKRRPMLVAADIYRPAAVKQLQVLGERLGVPVHQAEGVAPPQLCREALALARQQGRDVVIFDTAGRLAIDDALMQELEAIKAATRPDNILLVCDAMAGQDTVRTAAEFNRRLTLSGFIMTKLDGDARGGAALSIKAVTGRPIKFLGMGEGLDKLEPFRPEGLASRILGMGDIVGLMRDFEQVVDEKQAERDAKKLLRGQFTLDDFLIQLRTLRKVGSVKDIFEKLPLFGDAGPPAGAQVDDAAFTSMEALIQSMTPAERRDPKIIDASRGRRIARGSGRTPVAVTELVQRFGMMHQLMAGLSSNPGMLSKIPGLGQLAQLRKLKTRGLSNMPGMPGMLDQSRGQLGGMPGLPGAMPGGSGSSDGAGISPADYAALLRQQQAGAGAPRSATPQQKAKVKDKRRAEKKARKKSRR